jgi:hypothetical protein
MAETRYNHETGTVTPNGTVEPTTRGDDGVLYFAVNGNTPADVMLKIARKLARKEQ